MASKGLRITVGIVLLACRPADQVQLLPRLTVVASVGRLEAPDSVAAGWLEIGLTNPTDDGGHNLVVVALPRDADVPSFIATLDSSIATPSPGVALGGPEGALSPADTLRVAMELEPGRYLLTCLVRDPAGHRHTSRGEWRLLEVTLAASSAERPLTTIELPLTDFAYPVTGSWPTGRHRIRVVNRGQQDHLVRIDRLRPGATLASWLKEPDEVVEKTMGGVARLGAGRSVVLDLQLEAGSYVLYCLVTDPQTGRVHAELGMVRLITVGASDARPTS